MTKILQLTFALLLFGNVGFAQNNDLPAKPSRDCEKQSCNELSNWITDQCASCMTDEQCAQAKAFLENVFGSCNDARRTSTKLGPYSLTDGYSEGYNISIIVDNNDKDIVKAKILFRDAKGLVSQKGKDINLADNTIEIYFTKKDHSEFEVKVHSGDQTTMYKGDLERIPSASAGLDVKLIPKLKETEGPGIVGGNDARDLKVDDGVSAPLDYEDFPLNRKILIHQAKNGDLWFGGSKMVSITAGKIDPSKVGAICWGKKMEKCVK